MAPGASWRGAAASRGQSFQGQMFAVDMCYIRMNPFQVLLVTFRHVQEPAAEEPLAAEVKASKDRRWRLTCVIFNECLYKHV